jgi:hypothetical protein
MKYLIIYCLNSFRKEQDHSKELEKVSQEEYRKLKLRYQANAKKINEIYNVCCKKYLIYIIVLVIFLEFGQNLNQ